MLWLEPIPDDFLTGLPDAAPDPATRYEALEAISLAFVTALQLLPARQRAALILRDVLGFRASEVATLLDSTEESVTSALKRARAAVDRAAPQRHAPSARSAGSAGSRAERELLDRLTLAFENNDVDGLVAMLTNDVLVSMPPLPLEYLGLEPVTRFLEMVFRPARRRRVTPTRANGQPALVVYVATESGVWRSPGILVFTVSGDQISAITHFDRIVLPFFGIPDELTRQR